jgi:hypothetical protein
MTDETDVKLPSTAIDDDEPYTKRAKMPKYTKPELTKIPSTKKFRRPSTPSFAWKKGPGGKLIPDLADGETVLKEGEKNGVKIVVTSCGQKIYLCTIAEYEDKICGLQPRPDAWRAWYPHAAE